MKLLGLPGLLACFLVIAGSSHSLEKGWLEKQQGDHISIIYSGDLYGTLRPLPNSATQKQQQLTSMFRRVRLIASTTKRTKKKKEGLLLVDSGNLLFPPGKRLTKNDFAKAHTIAKTLATLNYDAVGLGAADLAAGLSFLEEVREQSGLTFINSNIVAQINENKTLVQGHLIVETGRFKIGILSVLAPELLSEETSRLLADQGYRLLPPAQTAKRRAARLKQQGADLVVLLSQQDWQGQLKTADIAKEITFIINGGSNKVASQPVARNNNFILTTRGRGKQIGLLRFVRRSGATDFLDASTYYSLSNNLLSMQQQLTNQNEQQAPSNSDLERRIGRTKEKLAQLTKVLSANKKSKKHLVFNTVLNMAMNFPRR